MMSLDEEVQGIAVVGMAGRFPGADDIDTFWRRLCAGEECLTRFTSAELRTSGVPESLLHDPRYVPVNGILKDVELFDAAFFGMNPREASITDPQHRVFLELAWHALENAGHDPSRYRGSIGVYAGCGSSSYMLHNLWSNRADLAEVGDLRLKMGNGQEYLATRVSYKLNLTGPSLNINTACSTSLVAVHVACDALLNFQCDMALAGGVSIQLPQVKGYLYEDGGILSPDGHCRAFDSEANGTVSGNGGAVVVLKRLSDALADGNTVYAVIRGSAINNDGSGKAGYTAPSVTGQARVIAEAQAMSGINAGDIGYVETHGTGTPLGDPIEFAALTQAFREQTDRVQFCAIGSVKTNVGHLDEAAGVTGLIKTVLSLYHGQIPPSLHFRSPNAELDYVGSPFYVNTQLHPWPAPAGGRPRAAAVSSFGIGGTNAHVVLEEAPSQLAQRPARPLQILPYSAASPGALRRHAGNLAAAISRYPTEYLADVAWTLQVGRRASAWRHYVVASNTAEACAALQLADADRAFQASADPPPVVFLFSGQGSQHPGMAGGLYAHEPVFRNQLDTCADLLKRPLGRDLRRLLYPGSPEEERIAATELTRTELAQPALFAVEYALAKLWQHWGVQPTALIGHSVGEYVAACLAGVMDLEVALAVLATRGRLMQSAPEGAMLAIPLGAEALERFLTDGVGIAAVNAPDRCVIAGPTDAIEMCVRRLAGDGIQGRRLHVSHAFHSASMAPILEEFGAELRRHVLRRPEVSYVSNLTGDWITPEEATDPDYYVQHLRRPVQFAAGLMRLLRDHPRAILLEVGPSQALMQAAQRCVPAATPCLPSCPLAVSVQDDLRVTLSSLGELWARGVPLDWTAFAECGKRRVPLPGHPFERKRLWIEPRDEREPGMRSPAAVLSRHPDPDTWFYAPSWTRSVSIEQGRPSLDNPDQEAWMLCVDDCGVGSALAERLTETARQVITVHAGGTYARTGRSSYTVRPGVPDDFDALIHHLAGEGSLPRHIVHLWCVDERDDFRAAQDGGFYSLLFLVQALARHELPDGLRIAVVSSGIHDVTGEETLNPAKATVLGPVHVIPQEFPDVTCRNVDIRLRASTDPRWASSIEQLRTELISNAAERIVALRGRYRWTQTFDRVQLGSMSQSPGRLRPEGVYLITGGLGNIGLVLAEYLAEAAQARLVLAARSPFPPRDDWSGWLASRGNSDSDAVSRTIRRLQHMESLGARALTLQADVADEEAMGRAIARAEALFGPINGVIHAAGVNANRSFVAIEELQRTTCEEHLDVKARGLMVLDQLFRNRQPDFFLLFSSLSSVLGGLGFAAYSAANQFLDAAARKHAQEGGPAWISVNWDGWQVGMNRDSASPSGSADDPLAITPAEGRRLFEQVFGWQRGSQIVVSTGDLQARITRWVDRAPMPAERQRQHAVESDGAEAVRQPQAPNSPLQTGDPVEEDMAAIWKDMLGVDRIDAHDNFFKLNGDSLLATQLIAQINRRFGVHITLRDFFERPTVSAVAAKLRGHSQGSARRISSAPPSPDYPVTHAQKRLWILAQNPEASIAYNMTYALSLHGALNVEALRHAFQTIVARHEVLRTAFVTVRSEPRQQIRSAPAFTLGVADLHTASELPGAIDEHIRQEAATPFRLDEPPLLRARLLRTGEQEHVLLASLHHIVADGLTLNVLMRELHTCYAALCQQRNPELPPLPIQFKDFAVWQQQQLSGEGMQARRTYWLEKLAGDLPALELPTDRPRPHQQQFSGGQVVLRLPAPERARLHRVCQVHEVTLFTLLVATTKVLLHHLTGQEDILVGTPVAGREQPELEGQIGYYLNNIVLRGTVRRSEPFTTLLRRAYDTVTEALVNQDYPFDLLVEELAVPAIPGHAPLFDVQINLMPTDTPPLRLGDLSVSALPSSGETTMFDLNFMFSDTPTGLALDIGYATALFDAGTVERLGQKLLQLLQGVGEKPDSAVRSLCHLLEGRAPAQEKAQFLAAALDLSEDF